MAPSNPDRKTRRRTRRGHLKLNRATLRAPKPRKEPFNDFTFPPEADRPIDEEFMRV